MVRELSVRRAGAVLISDFDGTMTQHDFYKLAIEKLLPPETPDHWAEYRCGAITHFEALARYFAAIRGREEDVLSVVRQMELDSHLQDAVDTLRSDSRLRRRPELRASTGDSRPPR